MSERTTQWVTVAESLPNQVARLERECAEMGAALRDAQEALRHSVDAMWLLLGVLSRREMHVPPDRMGRVVS